MHIHVLTVQMSDSNLYQQSSTSQAMEKCISMFLRNTTYQNTDVVRPIVQDFLDRTCANMCYGNGDCQMGL